jgi:hypothetical protein
VGRPVAQHINDGLVCWPCVYAAALRLASRAVARPAIFAAFFYPFDFKKENSGESHLPAGGLLYSEANSMHNVRACAAAVLVARV